jgi:hypothetical protein
MNDEISSFLQEAGDGATIWGCLRGQRVHHITYGSGVVHNVATDCNTDNPKVLHVTVDFDQPRRRVAFAIEAFRNAEFDEIDLSSFRSLIRQRDLATRCSELAASLAVADKNPPESTNVAEIVDCLHALDNRVASSLARSLPLSLRLVPDIFRFLSEKERDEAERERKKLERDNLMLRCGTLARAFQKSPNPDGREECVDEIVDVLGLLDRETQRSVVSTFPPVLMRTKSASFGVVRMRT